MSAEHLTNQSHLRESNNRLVNTETTKLNNELAKDIKPLTKVPRIDRSAQIETSTIQQLISQQSDKTKQQITKQSYDYMRQANSLINPELNEQLENEIDAFFNKKPLNTNDEVSLSSQALKKTEEEPDQLSRNQGANAKASQASRQNQKNKINKQNQESWVNENEAETTDDAVFIKSKEINKKNITQKSAQQPQLLQEDLKEFAKLISKHALSQDPNAKQIIEKKRNQLLQKGLTTHQLNFATSKVGLLVKHHFVYDLKQKLINYHMSKGFSKQDIAEHSNSYHSSTKMLNELRNNGQLTSDITGMLDQIKHQARQDLSHFLFDESVNQFTKQSLGQISLKEFTEELVKLQKAAQSAGVTISEKELTEKIYNAIDNLGLSQFSPPNSNSQQQQQKQPEQILSQEEVLDDKLRYLYMMKALHPSLRKKVDLHFKMKKCKNGMIKLGVYTEEKEEALKKQGEFLAAKQFREELEFIFREEATLENLNGSEYGVIRKKKAFFLTQLRKINHGLSNQEIDRMKESMYQEMYALMKEEIMQLEQLAEIHKHVSISRKLKHFKSVVERITSDVTILDHQSMFDKLKAPLQTSTINEGA